MGVYWPFCTLFPWKYCSGCLNTVCCQLSQQIMDSLNAVGIKQGSIWSCIWHFVVCNFNDSWTTQMTKVRQYAHFFPELLSLYLALNCSSTWLTELLLQLLTLIWNFLVSCLSPQCLQESIFRVILCWYEPIYIWGSWRLLQAGFSEVPCGADL